MNEIFTTTENTPRDNERPQMAPQPFLFVVLHADKPTYGGARYGLSGIDEVTFGRGPARGVLRTGDGRLDVRLPSATVSKAHARLVRRGGDWFLEDLGSKNGCAIHGERVTNARIYDGDFIEIGSILLRFRAALPVTPGHTDDVERTGMTRETSGRSSLVPSIAAGLEALSRIASLPITTLFLGETGTGKEVLAKSMHAMSGRKSPMVAVNCGGLTSTLVESQLFGHVKGSFTGATRDEPGFIRSADGGTLFLDEIGDLPLPAQGTLLRVLQEREVVPVGGSRPTRVDVRVIAATNKPLDTLCLDGKFRADLLARLSGYQHTLPPLRDRLEDLGLLMGDILQRSTIHNAAEARWTTRVAWRLLTHTWPLNIRELENAITVAVALADQGVVEWAHLPESLTTPRGQTASGSDQASNPGEHREQLEALLRQHQGNVSALARATGKSRMQIHRWMQRFGIDPDQYRG